MPNAVHGRDTQAFCHSPIGINNLQTPIPAAHREASTIREVLPQCWIDFVPQLPRSCISLQLSDVPSFVRTCGQTAENRRKVYRADLPTIR